MQMMYVMLLIVPFFVLFVDVVTISINYSFFINYWAIKYDVIGLSEMRQMGD